jgi:membrane fusion protein
MTAQTPLFRSEVLAARRDHWLGEAQIVQPLPVRMVSIACALLSVALVLLLTFGTYTRRVHADGVLAPATGLITVASPRAGRVISSGVQEGDKVAKGQLLYALDTDAVSASGPTQVRIIEQLNAQTASVERQRTVRTALAVIEKRALQEQLTNTIDQNDETRKQVTLQTSLTQSLKDRADQLQQALSSGVARASDFQSQNFLYIQSNAQLAQFEQMALQLQGKVQDLRSQIAGFDDKLTRELAEMSRSIAQLKQQIAESEAKQAIEVRAPESGILTSIRIHAGQQVPAGGTLLTLLPSIGRLQANLYVESSAIGFVEKGQTVMLRYAAFPFQRFGLYRGGVSEVTRAPVDPSDAPRSEDESASSAQPSRSVYRITVAPDRPYVTAYGEPHQLEAGMRVEADIALEKRPLYRWLLDPVYHLKRSAELVTGMTR